MDQSQKVKVSVELDLDHELEIDDNGDFNVLTTMYTEEEDVETEVRTSIDTLVTSTIEYHMEDLSHSGYSELYRLGNEFSRLSEIVLEAAQRTDDLINGAGVCPDEE
jgi:hypothetical protein